MKALKRFSVGKFHARIDDPINSKSLSKTMIERLVESGHISAPEAPKKAKKSKK